MHHAWRHIWLLIAWIFFVPINTLAEESATSSKGIAISVKAKQGTVDVYIEFLLANGDRVRSGGGSGFFVDSRSSSDIPAANRNSYVLTNHHVITHGKKHIRGVRILKRFVFVSYQPTGRDYETVVIGHSAYRDVALLQVQGISRDEYTPLPLGGSDVLVGQTVFVIGSPLDLRRSFTRGVVSAINRRTTFRNNYIEDFIQIDAPINPGNSGGALFNEKGELIGMPSMKRGIGFAESLGFCIPVRLVQIKKLLRGEEKKPWLGLECLIENFPRKSSWGDRPQRSEDIFQMSQIVRLNDPQLVSFLCRFTHPQFGKALAALVGKKRSPFTVVRYVEKDSPAWKAGIRAGNIITKVNGQKIRNGMDVREAILDHIELNKPFEIEYIQAKVVGRGFMGIAYMPELKKVTVTATKYEEDKFK